MYRRSAPTDNKFHWPLNSHLWCHHVLGNSVQSREFCLFCLKKLPLLIPINGCVRRSITHSCASFCLMRGENNQSTSGVFRRGKHKARRRRRGIPRLYRGGISSFIPVPFAILFTFSVICSVLISKTLPTLICNKQLFRKTPPHPPNTKKHSKKAVPGFKAL